MSQIYILSFHTLAKVIIYQSIHWSDLAGFLTRLLKFSRRWNKFEVWQHFPACFVRFFCLQFYNGIQSFSWLTEHQIYNIEIGLFLWWRTYRSKNMQIPDILFSQVGYVSLIEDDDVWKHFKYWLSSKP